MRQIISTILLATVVSLLNVSFFSQPLLAKDEQGIGGVTVMVCDADGKVVAKSKTDKDGNFSFSNLKTSADYYLKIDEKDKKSKFAIKEQGIKRVSTETAPGLSYILELELTKGFSVKSPRDAASGLATGKRTHHPMRITSDFESCSIAIDEPGVHFNGRVYSVPNTTSTK